MENFLWIFCFFVAISFSGLTAVVRKNTIRQ